jgi:DNA-binding MurR/RpiR family transcriptional regulator
LIKKNPRSDTRTQLLQAFDTLSPALRNAARYLIDHPNDVIVLSMRALAERASVQPAALVRLAQQLHYAGYPALKAAFVADFGLVSASYSARAKTLLKQSDRSSVSAQMFDAQAQNLNSTRSANVDRLRDAVNVLKSARSVYVAGFRASYPLSHALVYGYRLFRDSVHLVDAAAGSLEMQVRPIARGDALVVISFAPYSKEAIATLEAAARAGAKTLAITDSETSPLAKAANVSLLFSVASPSFFPSITAGFGVIEALLALLLIDGGDAAVRKVEQAETMLKTSGAYVTARSQRRAALKKST